MNEDILKLQKQIDAINLQLNLQSQGVTYGIDFANLTNFIEVVTTSPNVAGNIPDTIYEQVKIYYNSVGPAWSLFLYDRLNGVWKSVILT